MESTTLELPFRFPLLSSTNIHRHQGSGTFELEPGGFESTAPLLLTKPNGFRCCGGAIFVTLSPPFPPFPSSPYLQSRCRCSSSRLPDSTLLLLARCLFYCFLSFVCRCMAVNFAAAVNIWRASRSDGDLGLRWL